jgi:hypothetical protein
VVFPYFSLVRFGPVCTIIRAADDSGMIFG